MDECLVAKLELFIGKFTPASALARPNIRRAERLVANPIIDIILFLLRV